MSWTLLLVSSANAAVRAWLDNDQVVPGDTVRLVLQYDGRTSAQPDLAPLKQDFDILATSRSSNVQIVNGSVSSKTQLQLTLSPKHDGHLSIPAIAWDGESSQPLALNVTGTKANSSQSGGQSAGAQSANNVFLETKVDQAQPYVQAGVNVTVRLYTAEQLYRAGLDFPTNGDVVVQQVGADRQSTAERNGQRYQMIERHYLAFPQHSGSITIPGAILSAQIATHDAADALGDDDLANFFGRSSLGNMLTSTKPIRLHGASIVLSVRPRPASAHANYWLPATDVTLKGDWQPEQTQAHVGDPLTLNLHLQAEGLTAAQLPDLVTLLNVPAGVKAYPDQAKLNNANQGDTVVGTRDQSIALIADQPGNYTIPELRVHWWDTKADAAREVTLPSRSITVLPSTGVATVTNTASNAATNLAPRLENNSATTTTPASNASHSTATETQTNNAHWQWISFGIALLWIGTLGIWWFFHRRANNRQLRPAPTTPQALPPDASRARREFHEACRLHNAQLARRKLLEWVAAASPKTSTPPIGMRALAKQLNDATIDTLLLELDRASYVGGGWDGAKLLKALNDLPKSQATRTRASNAELAPLYHEI
jgi:hypothetical protein